MEGTTNNLIADIESVIGGVTMGDIGAYISLGIYLILAVSALSGLLFGLGRGFGKGIIRLITIVISLVAAYIIASSVSGWLAGFFAGKTLLEVIAEFNNWAGSIIPGFAITFTEEIEDILVHVDMATAQNIISLVLCLFISPSIFALCFYILKVATMLVYWLVSLMCGMAGKNNFFSSLGGGLVGALQGMVISLVLLIPIAGFTQLASEARVLVQESEVPEYTKEQVEDFYTNYLDFTLQNPMLDAINSFGGEVMFTGLTTATIEEEKVDMGEVAKDLFLLFVDGVTVSDIDFVNPTPWGEHLVRMTEDIGSQRFTASTISGIVRSIAKAFDAGALVIPAEEPIKSLILDMFKMLTTSDENNLEGDLKTLVNIYLIMGEHGLLAEITEGTSEGILDKMLIKTDSGEIVIDLIIDELGKNPRTTLLLDSFAKISVAALSNSITLEEDATEIYNNVKDGVNEVLQTKKENYETEEEYKEALGENLDETLKENGITLEEGIIDEMANYIAENFSEKDEITDQDVTDAILYYYSAYMNNQIVIP